MTLKNAVSKAHGIHIIKTNDLMVFWNKSPFIRHNDVNHTHTHAHIGHKAEMLKLLVHMVTTLFYSRLIQVFCYSGPFTQCH